MPAERLSMRKIKEVLRLKFGLGFANRQIARSCSINHSTVADYLYRAKAAGLRQWPLPDGLDKAGLEKRLFPAVAPRAGQLRAAPSWPAIHEDLHGHKHVTLQLVWQEYKQSNPDGYQYSRFCWLYQQWADKLDLVLRQEHRAGEKLFVDYAGDTVAIVDSKTGTIQKAQTPVSQAGGQPCRTFRQDRSPRSPSSTRRILPVCRVEKGAREHRLSHRNRTALLQRSLCSPSPRARGALHGDDRRDLPPRPAHRQSCPQLQDRRPYDYRCASAQVPSTLLGVDT